MRINVMGNSKEPMKNGMDSCSKEWNADGVHDGSALLAHSLDDETRCQIAKLDGEHEKEQARLVPAMMRQKLRRVRTIDQCRRKKGQKGHSDAERFQKRFSQRAKHMSPHAILQLDRAEQAQKAKGQRVDHLAVVAKRDLLGPKIVFKQRKHSVGHMQQNHKTLRLGGTVKLSENELARKVFLPVIEKKGRDDAEKRPPA
jgi:predicted exporter